VPAASSGPVLADRERAIVQDLGGEDALSAVARDLARRHAGLSIVADHLWENISGNGVLTTKGKQRAALSAYALTVDRLVRLSQLLGLERKPADSRISAR
jgi:hypothetical protein